jgi:activator of HSP90 ATPase
VNAWHWTEKDVSGWTKQRLEELLGGLQLFSDTTGSAAITELEAVQGERHA